MGVDVGHGVSRVQELNPVLNPDFLLAGSKRGVTSSSSLSPDTPLSSMNTDPKVPEARRKLGKGINTPAGPSSLNGVPLFIRPSIEGACLALGMDVRDGELSSVAICEERLVDLLRRETG